MNLGLTNLVMIFCTLIITLTVNWTRQTIKLRKDMIDTNPQPKEKNYLMDSIIIEDQLEKDQTKKSLSSIFMTKTLED